MPVESAADRAVFTNLEEFGAAIFWADYLPAVQAIVQSGTILLGAADGPDSQTREATLVVSEADLPLGHAEDDPVRIGGIAYLVRSIEPDGTGMALVRLELSDG